MTVNRRFVKALRRQQRAIDELKRRFENVAVENCPYEILLLAIVDQEESFLKVVPGDQDIFEVEVGYDAHGEYPPDDDVLVVQLLEEKLMQMIDACEDLGETRKPLRDVVESWTTEVIAQ
jgi:hypothetical protein